MPDGLTVGIRDFAVVHNAGHAVRVRDILGGIQIVHRPLQRGVTVAVRSQIPRGVQVHFCQQNIAENTVVLHLVGTGVHGVGIFVVGDSRGVCGVGLICLATAKGDSDHTLTGVDERTATVGRGNIRVIIGVPQPNGLSV